MRLVPGRDGRRAELPLQVQGDPDLRRDRVAGFERHGRRHRVAGFVDLRVGHEAAPSFVGGASSSAAIEPMFGVENVPFSTP